MDVAFQQGFVSALLDVLFNKVTDVFLHELKKIINVDNAVEHLETTILKAQDLHRRVDISHLQGNDKLAVVVRKRVDTLTTLCYDIEDVMDEIALMIAKHSSSSGKKGWRVRDVILRNMGTWNMPHTISKLQLKLNSILDQLTILEQLTDLNRALSTASDNLNLETLSIEVGDCVKKSPLVGRDNDVQKVIELLILCRSDDGVSIIGMDGLGKTALAQIIMNDAKIAQEFPIRLWATVSKGSLEKKETLAKLGKKVQAGSNKKSLIIIDDLSEVMILDWDNFLSVVKAMGEAKFLITTCDRKVSETTGTTPYDLGGLSVECCKSVIMEKARSHNRELSGPRLLQVADILACKCEGLPLVARTIGLVLAKYDEDRWDTLCMEDLWEWPVFKDEIYPVLNSSYEDLRPDVKNCFAFLSLFPHDYRFHTDDLVQLWVGAGFIVPERSKSWDEIGSYYLEELQGRSILQFCDDRQRWFELHRFNHTFAQLAASKTCKRLDGDMSSALHSLYQNTRHLSLLLSESVQPTTWSSIGVLKRLCTLLLLNVHNNPGQSESMIPPDLFKKTQRLRVLALSNTITKLPDSIKKLQHLRFLDASGTRISSFPETLCKLHGLQILKFGNTSNLTRLPKDLQKLTNLLFLDWDESKMRSLVGGVPCNIGKLESLHNLPLFQVGENEGQSMMELQNMNSLRGSIHIEKLENVKGRVEAAAAKLHEKSSLKRIVLRWNSTSKNASKSHDVLEELKLPKFVKEVKIIGYGCERFPQWWLSDRFPMLQKIHLLRCRSCISLPALQRLPVLKDLILEDMTQLRSVDITEPFPSLEILEFKNMPNLQEWKGLEVNAMPQLLVFKLISCPKTVNFPSLENLTSLEVIEIDRCKALESLSELPTSLSSLLISECPKLKDQCQVGGKEWLRIQSVLGVVIDGKRIPTTCAPNFPLQHICSTGAEDVSKDIIDSSAASKYMYGAIKQDAQMENIANSSLVCPMSRRWRVLGLIVRVTIKMRAILSKVNKSREKMKLYCFRLFLNDYEFQRETLVQLWMAMGFSSQSSVEKFCERYFDLLLDEQYIIFSSIDIVTGRYLYKVTHEGNDNMDEKKTNKEDLYAVLEYEDANGSKSRHISLVSNCISETTFKKLQNFSGELRTLLFIPNYGSSLNKIPSDMFLIFEFLRALDLSGSDIVELPRSIGNVRQLRYLDLSFTLIEGLPESIDQLHQLQTLKLQGCKHLHELPEGIKELICLRHLDLNVLGQLTFLPKGIGALTELCTLSAFLVDSEEGCSIRELKFLNKLKGSFCVSGLENVAHVSDFKEAALEDKKYVTQLQLRWSDRISYSNEGKQLGNNIIASLSLNRGLQDLQIVCYPGSDIPAWVDFREQRNLISITLLNCNNNDLSLPLGQLPNLKYLSIIHMNWVTKIKGWSHEGGDEAYVAFPKLEKLEIECMFILETWIDEFKHGDFPFLSTLIIKQCPKLTRLPFLPHLQVLKHLEVSDCPEFKCLPDGALSTSLETLIIDGCPILEKRCSKEGEDWHKVKHIPNIWIDLQEDSDDDSTSTTEDI